jgi:hypothetical protein
MGYTAGAAAPVSAIEVIEQSDAASAWFDSSSPDEYVGLDMDVSAISIGKTSGGGEAFAMIRFSLFADFFADEVNEARLKLKLAGGAPPEALRVGLVSDAWDAALTTRPEARAMLDALTYEQAAKEDDGWISADVTQYVKAWLSGGAPNYGFALYGADDAPAAAFVSSISEDAGKPRLTVTGTKANRRADFGKFPYTDSTFPGQKEDEGGNCLSYALRDYDMILADNLYVDYDDMNIIYKESGDDGVAEYSALLVERYVSKHGGALAITNLRRIDSYDSPIDASNEYRIALRVGCHPIDGEFDLSGKSAFDFHVRAQVNDGRWAQKFPLDPSMIVPGSAADIDPGKYPWDAALMWSSKFQNYYDSGTIYFAVTKTTDALTSHLTKK